MSLKNLADETLQLIDNGCYEVGGKQIDFSVAQAKAIAETRLYTPDDLRDSGNETPATTSPPTIRVVDGTTQAVAGSLASDTDVEVGILNFASARNPGGGFLNGAKAQEEDICRCSGLYPCLLQCMEYYEFNRRQKSLLYSDYSIFSPRVPFFKTRGTGELLETPFFVSVITSPAPNSGPFLKENPEALEELEQTFARRWCNVLRIAKNHKLQCLVLGAWGCGAFQGDPTVAARTAKKAILSDGQGISNIAFAIPSKGRQSKANLLAFQAAFEE